MTSANGVRTLGGTVFARITGLAIGRVSSVRLAEPIEDGRHICSVRQFTLIGCRRFAWLVVLCVSLLAGQWTQAADSTSTSTEGAQVTSPDQSQTGVLQQLQEVVVTAEKRTQNLQAVPNSIQAISGASLTTRDVPDIINIQNVAPDVEIATGNSSFVNIAIRGVHSGSFGPTTDSPNTLYVDGAPLTTFSGLNGLYFDLQEVDVLDGPQGTLYGRNSVGGLINFITNKPSQTFGGYGTLEVGNYDDLSGTVAASLPITDDLAMRVALRRYSHAGYMTDSGQVDADQTSGRFELQWKPTSVDTVLFTADNARVGGNQGSGTTITGVFKSPTVYTNTATGILSLTCPGGASCTSAVVPIRVGTPWQNGVLVGNGNFSTNVTDSDGFMLEDDHTFSFATLTTQVSRRSSNTSDIPNASGITGLNQSASLVALGLFLQRPSAQFTKSQWDSEEIRLVSTATRPFSWVAGLFRYHDLGTNNNSIPLNTSSTNSGGFVISAPTAPIGPDITIGNAYASDLAAPLNNDNAYAPYAQSIWTPGFAPSLHVTGGVRYNWEHKHDIGYHWINGVGFENSFDMTDSWRALTWKANVAYDLGPQNMVYIDRSNGFQSGGFGFGPDPEYQPERIQAWEIGSKNRFLDNRLQVNVSAWYYAVDDLLTAVTDVFTQPTAQGPMAVPFISITNAGTALIRGQSLDLQWLITSSDRVQANFQHLDAQFLRYDLTSRYVNGNYFGYCVNNPNGAPPCANPVNYFTGYSQTGNQGVPSFNYSHTPVGAAPKYAADVTYDHIFESSRATVDAGIVFHFVGSQLSGNQAAPFTYPYPGFFILPAYSYWDFSLNFQPSAARWSVTAFIRNAFDKAYQISRGYTVANGLTGLPYTNSAVTYAYATAAYGPPRTFGAIFNFNF